MAKKSIKKPAQNAATATKAAVQKGEKTKPVFSMNLKLAFLLGLFSFAVYANTLKNGFAYDDFNVIKDNTIVTQGVSAIPEILSTPYRKGFFVASNDLYRPFSLVLFATEYQFWGTNPTPYHLINILLFAGCVLLLFLFLDMLFAGKKTGVAFIASLLFALHPIHTEVVANIKSCDELLCFFFAFLCMNLFIKYAQSGKITQLVTGTACFFLSLLSKETVITFIAVIPLIFFFIKNENKKRSSYLVLCAACAAIIFLAIRFAVLSTNHANEITAVNFIDNALAKGDLPFESRIATAILIMGYYIKLLFVPYPLIFDYSYNTIPYVHFSDPRVLISLAIYIFLTVFSIKRFLKDHKDPYAFGILFFLITMSLFSNILLLIGTTMGERLLFFPSVGFCLIVALLVKKLVIKPVDEGMPILKNGKILGVIIPICLIYGFVTMERNTEWLDNSTLFAADIIKAPDNSRLNFFEEVDIQKNEVKNEKDTAKLRQLREKGITYLKKAIAIFPDYAEAHIDLGFCYLNNLKYDSAEVHYKYALRFLPENIDVITGLGKVYFDTKQYTP